METATVDRVRAPDCCDLKTAKANPALDAFGPGVLNIGDYRKMIYANIESGAPIDPSVVEAAGKSDRHLRQDVAAYRARVQAAANLAALPERRAEVERLRAAEQEALNIGSHKLVEFKTLAALATALFRLSCQADGLEMPETRARRSCEEGCNATEANALRVLHETVDAAGLASLAEAQRRRDETAREIAAAKASLVDLPARIETQLGIVRAIARGNPPLRMGAYVQTDQKAFELKKLEDLQALAKREKQILQKIAADETALPGLVAKADELAAKQLEPRRMVWAD